MAAFCGFASWQLICQGVHVSTRACVGRVGVAWRQPKSRQVCAHFYESVAACYFGWIWKIMRHSSALLSLSVSLTKVEHRLACLLFSPFYFFSSFLSFFFRTQFDSRRDDETFPQPLRIRHVVAATIAWQAGRQAGNVLQHVRCFRVCVCRLKQPVTRSYTKKFCPRFDPFFLCVKDF